MIEPPFTQLLPRTELDGLERIETPFGQVLVWGTRRPGADRASEDSVLVHCAHDHLVLVVADGAGGHALGGEASEAAVRAMARAFERESDEELDARLRRARHEAVRAVAGLGREAITTVALATLQNNKLTTWHAGDSTILLMGQRGRRKLRTVDHTPPGLEVAAGTMTLDEARAHGERNLLVNALGSDDVGWESNGPIDLGDRDTLVLATDGLFDNLSDDEVVEHLRKGPFERSLVATIEANRERMYESDGAWPGKPDDVAIIAWRRH